VPAIGIALVISYLTHSTTVPRRKDDDEDASKEIIRSVVTAIASPFLVLLFGWIVHQFM
jgi:cytochrome bd-type quinol oxidase subunit 1